MLVRRRRKGDVREQRGTSLIQGGKATGGRTEDGTRWAGWDVVGVEGNTINRCSNFSFCEGTRRRTNRLLGRAMDDQGLGLTPKDPNPPKLLVLNEKGRETEQEFTLSSEPGKK